MTKTNTRSRIVSILLVLMMLLTMLPITALAAGIPDPTFVSVDGGKGFASPTKLYYKNGDTEDHFTGSSTDYNAAYDPATGTLTLNDYDGGRISLGGAAAYDLTIKLIGHNTVTVNDGYGDVGIDTNGSGSNITITADSSGSTLTIDLTANDKTVAGINNHLVGSVTSGNVTIKSYADVTINATTKATNKTCYGIYADDVVIEDDAKLAITVNAPNSKGGPIYGIFAKSDVTINTDGVITVDATNAGTTDRVYSTGINARNSLTLTKVGGMTVKWKDKDFGAPLSPSTASFNPAEYDTNVDTTNCIATYMPKSTTPTTYTVSFDANGGSGTMADVTGVSGEYMLPANGFTAPAGKQFKAWSVGGVEKAAGDKITVTANTTVTAVWEAIEYNVTVTGGTASVGAGTPITKATMGTTVTLTAGAAPTGKVFDKWEVVSGGITLADVNSATTTFTMPAEAVSVKATYKTTPVTTYNLTTSVNGGHGTISASKTGLTAGSTETITFSPDAGYEIDTVTVNGTATSVSGNTLNVTMNENKTVVVTYKAIEYNITVTDGKATVGAGTPITKATMGTTVTLTANAAPSGKVFDKWEVVSGSITLADATSASTTFTMPAEAVSVKATYKAIPHTHTYGSEWKYDADNHWHECSCGDKTDVAAHTASEWIIDTPATATADGAKHKECTVCKKVLETTTIPATGSTHTHSYGTDWKYDDTNHWHECQCGDKADTAAHSFQWVIDKAATKEATGIKHEECTVCGAKRSENTVIDKLPDSGNTGNTGSGDNNTNKPGKDDSIKSPQTGDSSNLIGWLAALFVSGGVLTLLGVSGKKRKESEAE